MIITESDRDSKSRPSDSTSIAQSSERSAEASPPAYNYNPGPSTFIVSEMSLIRPSVAPKGRGEPAWRRFIMTFFFAIVIYLLLAGLVKSIFHLTELLVQEQPDGPYDTDGRVVRCTKSRLHLEMEDQQQYPAILPPFYPPYTSRELFTVSSSSSLIFLLSRGSYDFSSSVILEMSDSSGGDVEIDVAMSYFNTAALDRAQVCLLERAEGGSGVGIFTPRTYYPKPGDSERIKFTVTVRFPRSGSFEHPLVINAFETHMGIWTHQIQFLEDRVVFNSLSIRGSNAPIRVESVSADAATFKTSNSPINGAFNVSRSLVLETSNAPITTNIQLENHDRHNPTQLEMKTSNGGIKTPITLRSTQSLWSPGAFSVNAKTSNSPLVLAFPDAPVSPLLFSLLELTAKTSNSPASVDLHATYEGSVLLKTSSMFTARLVQSQGTPDPSGLGRHRTVDVRRVVKSVFEAGVWWGDDPNKDEGKGSVIVTTSNSNNNIKLG